MIDEGRFQRIEEKVDDVKEEVGEIKADMRIHMAKVEEHVAGDKKIIDELQPVLAKLPTIVQMAEEYHFNQQFKKKVMKAFGVIALLAGIAASLSKVL